MKTKTGDKICRAIKEKFPQQTQVVKDDIEALQKNDLVALQEDLFGEIKSLIDHFTVVGRKLKRYYKQFSTVQKEDSDGMVS